MPEFVSPIKLNGTGDGRDITGHNAAAGDLLAVEEVQSGTDGSGAVVVAKPVADLGLMSTPGQVLPAWVRWGHGFFTSADGLGTWLVGPQGRVPSGSAGVLPGTAFAWDPATFTEAPAVLLAAEVHVNGLAPGLDLKIALRAVTLGGTAGQLAYTLGSELASHTFPAADVAAGIILTLSQPVAPPSSLGLYAVSAQWLNGSWLSGSAVAVLAGLQWTPFNT